MANSRGVLTRQRTQGNVKRGGTVNLDDAEVARMAYGLYEQRGREDGHALDDWLRAEVFVRQQQRPASQHIV